MIEYTVSVHHDGSKFWHFNGELHREDGPAVEYAHGAKFWYRYGLLHREDGPAIEYANGDKRWYIDDAPLTEEQFNARTKTKELTISEIEQLLGYKIKVVGND